MEEDPDYGLQACHDVDWAETEGFALSAIVGTSDVAANHAAAANDEPTKRPLHALGSHARQRSGAEGVVQRFAAGLRAMSRRRPADRR